MAPKRSQSSRHGRSAASAASTSPSFNSGLLCSSCRGIFTTSEFSKNQQLKGAQRRCKACIDAGSSQHIQRPQQSSLAMPYPNEFRAKKWRHLGGGSFISGDGMRWHQHPEDGDRLISDEQLAREFCESNEGIFGVDQVDCDVLAALWQIASLEDVMTSDLFLESAKEAAARSAKNAAQLGSVRTLITQGITRALVRRLPDEPSGQFTEHPFAAVAVQRQYLVFQVCAS